MMLKRRICILLALALAFGCAGFTPVHAADYDVATPESVTTQITDSEISLSPEIAQETELAQLCEDNGIFQYIDKDAFLSEKHIARLTEEEALNTYVFQNQDGTKSIYYLEEDVKYVAADGSIRDKDLTLIHTGTGYGVRSNNVALTIPDHATNGIYVSYNQEGVRLTPLNGSGLAIQDDNNILYEDFYGDGMDLRYSPILSGIKEDIILDAYYGVSSFDFLLETDSLYLYENEGKFYLAEQNSTEVTFYLGQIIVYDAIGRPSAGSMAVETVDPGQKYLLTISASEGFLTDPTTVYPVTIDPTITISDTIDAAMIEDSPVFSYYPNSNHTYGQFLFNSIGYTNATLGTGRTVFRFNGLLEDEVFNELGEEYINSVEFFVRDAGTYGYFWVNIHAILGNNTWTENTVTWNSVSNYSETVYASNTLGYSYWSTFDITELALAWKSGELDGQCGLIMVANDESQYITTCSTDYTNSNLWPYVVVTYVPDIVLNTYNIDVVVGKTVELNASVIPAANVTWISSDNTIAQVDQNGVVTGVSPGDVIITAFLEDGSSAECMVYVAYADGVYYIRNRNSLLYLQTNGSIDDGTIVYQNQLHSTQASVFDRLLQMWRIEYLEDGYYSIRPMYKLDMALQRQGTTVCLRNVGTEDTLLGTPAYSIWTISRYNQGYLISDWYSINSYLQIENASTEDCAVAVFASATTSTRNCEWDLIEVTEPPSGYLYYDSANNVPLNYSPGIYTVETNNTFSLSDKQITIITYSNESIDQSYMWSSSNEAIASVDENTGEITGYMPGQVLITGTNDLGFTISLVIIVVIPDGNYYILTTDNRCLYDGIGTEYVNTTNSTRKKYDIWNIMHVDSGYYIIHVVGEASQYGPYYLCVKNNSSNIGAKINTQTQISGAITRWQITISDNGNYLLIPENSDTNGYVLCGSAYDYMDGHCHLDQYNNDQNMNAEWVLYRIEQLSDVELELQENTQWCWAATSRMFAKHYYEGVVLTQEEVVGRIKGYDSNGSPKNEPGSDYEAAQAIRYYLSTIPDAMLSVGSTGQQVYTKEKMKELLDAGHVLYVARFIYSQAVANHATANGHATLICGYVQIKNDIRFIVMDPSQYSTNSMYLISYEKLYFGGDVKEYEAQEFPQYYWRSAVIVYTSYGGCVDNYYYKNIE